MKYYIQSEHGYFFTKGEYWDADMKNCQRFDSTQEAVSKLANAKLSDGQPVPFACEIFIRRETN